MTMKVRIIIGPISVEAELASTPCARAISSVLPITAETNEWGNEFYFEVPVHVPLDETATRDVKVGDIGYWPPGDAVAIFFGPTPLSSGEEPVPAGEVNMIGKIIGDAALLKKALGIRSITLEPVP